MSNNLFSQKPEPGRGSPDVGAVLQSMAETFYERNSAYKDTYLRVGPILKLLNVPSLDTEEQLTKYHLVMLCVVKLVRYVTSDMQHPDSVHDLGVYAAMLQELTKQ